MPIENITLFNALGTHRPNTDAELRGMIGSLFDQYRLAQNNAFDLHTQVCVGVMARGHEVWINREVAACDVKVLTGFIEPHFFAGFSGGGKALMPGMAGQRTVLGNHDALMISNPNATWGVTEGNPIWEEVMEVAEMVGGTFLCNVTVNSDEQLRRALLEPCRDVVGLVSELREKVGPSARICALPEGPQTIPYLRAM